MSCTVIVLILIKLEGIALLLDGIVSQMHEQVIYVLRVLAGWLKFLSGKASEALLIHEHAQRIYSIDEGVDSEVEFQSIDEVGIVQVLLGHVLIALLQLHVLEAAYQENTSPLAQMHWFYNEYFVAVFLGLNVSKLVAEVGHLRGQYPSLRKEVVVILEDFLHAAQIPTQVVLPRQLVHPREVVDALVTLKFCELIWQHSLSVIPKDVPISVLIVS